jgi:phosphoribosylformylglycinamidine (FGAM) synthase-like amidotransferase family enzyme
MLDESMPHLVIAFPGGRGTADMVKRSKAAGVHVLEVLMEDQE